MRIELSDVLSHVSRGIFLARSAMARAEQLRSRPVHAAEQGARGPRVAGEHPRSILFITTDQQRFDSLGVNGCTVARTPNLDRLAHEGINYRRAHVQNVVCMPSRSTMLTGQHPRTHGVIANGVSLPHDAPSVAAVLRDAGYRTALIGKAHFDPHLDPLLRFEENRLAAARSTGPWRGFEHVELATHGPMGGHHYAAWLWEHHPDEVRGFGAVLAGSSGGDTGAPEVKRNPIAREHYHTDWLAERAAAWLASVGDQPFFLWLSFPDPHHPFDPPADEVKARVDWRDLALPAGHPGSPDRIRAILRRKPRHWLDWYEERYRNPEGGPIRFSPQRFTHDQVREVNAMIHVENELIDEAVGRVLGALGEREPETDVVFTSDHGELQGDFGLMFKGPYHVDALMRVPLIWRPAARAAVAPAALDEPVGLVDLAPTFCAIAGLDAPSWMEGKPLPVVHGSGRERVLTTFDSNFAAVGMHLRTIYRDGWICTVYERSTTDRGGPFPLYWSVWGRGSQVPRYLGTEGELYNTRDDPHQWENRWDEPDRRAWRDELIADLRTHLPAERRLLPVAAPT